MKRNWFYYFEGERAIGPLEQSDVIERILAKKLSPYQLMIRDGEEEWRPALAFDEFRSYLLNIPTTREPSQSWVVLKRQDAGGHLAVESLGPFTSEEVREQIQAGKVEYTDYVWKDGMSQWRRISSLKEFSPFEQPVPVPKPVAPVMPPAPQIAKQVTREEVARKVEVARAPAPPKAEPPPPKEAVGPDLTKPQLPPEPPPILNPNRAPRPEPTIRPSSVSRGSPAGIERRRLPRTAHISVKAKEPEPKAQPKAPLKPPPKPPPDELTKTVLVEESKAVPEAKPLSKDSMVTKETKQPSKEAKPAASKSIPKPPPDPNEETQIVAEKTKSGIHQLHDEEKEKDSVVTGLSQLYNARITLPRNWKQILIVLVLLAALYIKLFGGPDTIPLSQIPQVPSGEIVPPPPPPPPPEQPQQQTQNDAIDNPPQEQIDPNAPGDEAIRRPLPTDPRPSRPTQQQPQQQQQKKKKEVVKEKEPTKLRAHMLVQNDGGASLQIDTDAGTNQTVVIEISSAAGQVVDHAHFYKRAKWTPGKPLSLGGELPQGYYHMKTSVGNLTSEERFEIGTRAKGFFDKLRQTRKQSAYEYWNERKRLYQSSQQLAKLVGGKHPNEFDRIARFSPTSFAFSDLWAELKEICQLAKKMDPSAAKRLQALQAKIASLSVWK